MKTIQLEIPEGKRAEWANGVLTLVDEKPIEYKFKVGDKVKILGIKASAKEVYEITELTEYSGEPTYELKDCCICRVAEQSLELIPQSITDRIKTFEDACDWCRENDKKGMTEVYGFIHNNLSNMGGGIDEEDKDIIAYLKLRIITCALNEGWEPTFDKKESRYFSYSYIDEDYIGFDFENSAVCYPTKLCFKSLELAEYAATQFADIYADFCGCKKGGKQ